MEKKTKKTRAQLGREILELKASAVYVYHYSSATIEKASTEYLTGSGVVLQLTALGGREIISPTLIRDGLSKETIEAIQSDIRASYELATLFKPKGI